VFLYTISSRNNALILNFSILFDGKVNIVGKLRRLKFKFSVVFKSAMKNKRKIKEKQEFYAKSIFNKIDFCFWCNFKTNMTVDTCNFHRLFVFAFPIVHDKVLKIF